MKFIFNVSPNLRQKQSTKKIMFELLIGLLIVFTFALFYYFKTYGMNYVMQAIKLMLVSIVVAEITEIAYAYVMKKDQKFSVSYVKDYVFNSFGWITAIILTLMCPISITPYALGVSTFFAILFGKLIFGGFGHNIFNPAAFGRAIIFATFMGATTDVITSATPTTLIATEYHWLVVNPEMINEMMDSVGGLQSLFTGWHAGALGETSALVILIVGIVLSVRKVIDYRVPLVYLGTIFVLAFGIACLRGVNAYDGIPGYIWYPLLHLLTGGAMFGAFFMLTDPVTSPTPVAGRCIFALGAAILTVLIRIKANLPEGCLYSILIMNMLSPMIEKGLTGKQIQLQKKARITFTCVAIVGLGSVLLAANVIEPREPDPLVFISTKDKEVSAFDAKIVEVVKNDDGTSTYRVNAQGYKSAEDKNAYNEFEIVVKNHNIISVTPTKIVDTEYIGDKVESTAFLVQFEGLDLSQDVQVEINDAVTGATFTSRSTLRAVEEVRKALGY